MIVFLSFYYLKKMKICCFPSNERLLLFVQRESFGLQSFLLDVLHMSTDTSQDSHVYLLEDGLQLWLCVLENTPSLPDSSNGTEPPPAAYSRMLDLYGNILPLMDTSTENFQLVSQITIAYIMLCPRHFLQK